MNEKSTNTSTTKEYILVVIVWILITFGVVSIFRFTLDRISNMSENREYKIREARRSQNKMIINVINCVKERDARLQEAARTTSTFGSLPRNCEFEGL